MKRNPLFSFLILLILSPIGSSSQEIDEDELFSDMETVVDSTKYIAKEGSIGKIDSSTVDLSGEISSIATINSKRDFFADAHSDQLTPGALLLGSFNLDVRLPENYKSFGNMELLYSSNNNSTTYSLKELFVDLHFNHKVYIRAGKQVIQWGRCNTWNPTDLVNVERKAFLPTIGSREGTTGIRAHIPFGVTWNLYGFIDMNDIKSIDSIAGSAKVEFLAGNTEMSLSYWDRRQKDPVFGFDISQKLLGWQFAGEVSLTKGTNYNAISFENGQPAFGDLKNDLITRAALNASRFFDFADVSDRIFTSVELYYNQGGDDGNIFKEPALLMLRDAMLSAPDTSMEKQAAQYIYGTYYEPNSYSRFYGALATSISKFIFSDLTLSAGGIINIDQKCATIYSSLAYRNLHNFFAGLDLIGYVGPKDTEYTLFKDALTVRVRAGIGF